jgi:hypothetical protein
MSGLQPTARPFQPSKSWADDDGEDDGDISKDFAALDPKKDEPIGHEHMFPFPFTLPIKYTIQHRPLPTPLLILFFSSLLVYFLFLSSSYHSHYRNQPNFNYKRNRTSRITRITDIWLNNLFIHRNLFHFIRNSPAPRSRDQR